jgi:hypothetical protein
MDTPRPQFIVVVDSKMGKFKREFKQTYQHKVTTYHPQAFAIIERLYKVL